MRVIAIAAASAVVGAIIGHRLQLAVLHLQLTSAGAPYPDAAERTYAQIRYLSTLGWIPEGETPAL